MADDEIDYTRPLALERYADPAVDVRPICYECGARTSNPDSCAMCSHLLQGLDAVRCPNKAGHSCRVQCEDGTRYDIVRPDGTVNPFHRSASTIDVGPPEVGARVSARRASTGSRITGVMIGAGLVREDDGGALVNILAGTVERVGMFEVDGVRIMGLLPPRVVDGTTLEMVDEPPDARDQAGFHAMGWAEHEQRFPAAGLREGRGARHGESS